MRGALIGALLCGACGGTMAGSDATVSDPDSGAPPPAPPVVETAHGPVEGTSGDGYVEFLGIPYAAAPVGDRRFRPPQPPRAWPRPRRSSRPQRCVQDALGLPLASGEDCLYVNVHTPDPTPETPAPVMVWIHGGAFLFGEGVQTDEGTLGDRLAQRGVVVVSMNYRLGPYGFLAHPALTAEQGASGNWGFMDQQAALRWVRDNVAAFGGDPGDVTLFGQSAGGLSTCLHMVAPESRGLFHRVIVQSGLCESALDDLAAGEAHGVALAERLGCAGDDAATCLREADVDAIDAADQAAMDVVDELSGDQAWWPIVDGVTVTSEVRDAVEGGGFADVPAIIGWTAQEGSFFAFLTDTGDEPVDEAAYRQIVDALADAHGVIADDIAAAYPLADYPDPAAAAAAAYGDATITCPSRRFAHLYAAHASRPPWVYRFDYPDAGFQIPTERELGAFHAGEIQFVFGHPAPIGQREFTDPDEVALHDAMRGAWLGFATSGAPGGDWPPFEDGELRVFDRELTTARGVDDARCALWDAGRAR